MKKMKQIISMLMVVIMLVNLSAEDVFAAPDISPETATDSEMVIEGTNGFGNLLSEDLKEYQKESETAESAYTGAYTVIDLVVELNSATVTYDAKEEALLIVALYSEDGLQLLKNAQTLVQPEEMTAVLTFEGEMPEYFRASAYMVDAYDFSPLCEKYETPIYTRAMQELLDSTVDDYDAERVWNLDDDKTTNFAVYEESTIVIPVVEGVNEIVSVDDETATYVIENADENITGLQKGDVFVYHFAENEMLIAKVENMNIEGTTATITGADLEMEEVFSHMKIEAEGTSSDLVVNESTCSEGVTYLGVQGDSSETYALQRESIGGIGANGEIKYHVFQIEPKEDKEEDNSVSVKGLIGVSLEPNFRYYISWTEQYIEFKVDVNIGVEVDVEMKLVVPVEAIELPEFGFYPVASVFIGFEPRVELQVTADLEWVFSVQFVLGFSYDNSKEEGFQNLCTVPNLKNKLNYEGKIFFGIDLHPKAKIAEGYVAELALKGLAGVELQGKMTGTVYETEILWKSKERHGCTRCLEGDVAGIIKPGVEFQLLKNDKWKFAFNVPEIKIPLYKFYCSLDFDEFRFGICPHKEYLVTFEVRDAQGNPKQGVSIKTTTDIACGISNDKGVSRMYLDDGVYTFEALLGEDVYEKSVLINEPRKVVINLVHTSADDKDDDFAEKDEQTVGGGVFEDIDPEDVAEGELKKVASGECGAPGDHVIWTLYDNGLMIVEGSGAIDVLANTRNYYGYEHRYEIKNVIVNPGVTYIGAYAFDSIPYLTSISLPDTLTGIGNNAFSKCDSLESIDIPEGVTEIGEDAFAVCENLVSVTLPETLNYMRPRAFQRCTKLSGIIIPEGVSVIEMFAFDGCYELKSVMLPSTLKSIERGAFSSCKKLPGINIPENVTEIGMEAFSLCNGLTNIRFSGMAPAIGNSAFSYIPELTVHYPLNDSSWTSDIMQDYGGSVTWVPYTSVNVVEAATEDQIPVNASYGGEYESETIDGREVKSASFKDLVPGGQYLLLAVKSTKTENLISEDNLLCIKQGKAAEDGTLQFKYVQKVSTDISYVVVCGPSGKNIKDAQITFPEMYSNDDVQVINPTVVYDGEILVEEKDYILTGTVGYTDAGEYTCCVKGVRNYTGIVECTYTVKSSVSVERIAGNNRNETSYKVADKLKTVLGLDKFDTVIVATGKDFADALAGSYLASVKNAPILLTNGKDENVEELCAYINENLTNGGKVYILGGESAVPANVETALRADHGNQIVRLAGSDRYETNLLILETAGMEEGTELIVATGKEFADSLSASALKKPILLVRPKEGALLSDAQKTVAGKAGKIYIIGGTNAVRTATEEEMKSFADVERIAGKGRMETSKLVAEKFFGNVDSIVLAKAMDFPDGLAGGPLAGALDVPLLLTRDGKSEIAEVYVQGLGIKSGYVLGGTGALADQTVADVFAINPIFGNSVKVLDIPSCLY